MTVLADQLAPTLAAAVAMFAGTNIDDLVVLTVLFLSARAGRVLRPWQIWAGQYAGIGALVAISVIAALGLALLPERWVGLLGLIPLALGVRGLLGALRASGGGEYSGRATATGVVSVAGVTIANGADNISVYTPVFRTIGPAATILTIAVFAAGVAVWCLAASWLSSHRAVIAAVERHGHWIVPLVFMAIGVVIIAESGILATIF
ncbi:cadmium resistance transporter [Nonomuraea turcica]|uniref:cadmium resistance transporter n=1 Tax=Nonomuraea sp. G32 TaxID=3067274 RepID=UPI00273CA525|nr:cadmium resistance transporter [Nonomuraea sp. G32]MDP4505894.1 cadmium resistance transporter [Nonomuraea sp. G32]